MKITLYLGHIYLDSIMYKSRVEAIIEWKDGHLSICAHAWDKSHTDYVISGQCLDTLLPDFKGDVLFTEIYDLWKKYHLNDMEAGTPFQKAAIEHIKGDRWYERSCQHLKNIGMYTVPAEQADPFRKRDSACLGKPFIFACEWLTHPIPEDDVKRIEALFH